MTGIRCRGFLAALFGALAVLAAGCGDGDRVALPGGGTPPALDAVPGAWIRVVHASPDAPAVDIYIQGRQSPLFTGLTFGTATGELQIEPGTPVLELRPAGSAATSPPLFSTDPLTIIPAERLILVAAGRVSPQLEESALRVVSVVAGFGAPSTQEATGVRLINAGEGVAAVGIDIGNDGSIEVPRLDRFGTAASSSVILPVRTSLQLGIVSAAGEPLTAFTVPPQAEGTEIILFNTGLIAAPPSESGGFMLLTVGAEGRTDMVLENPVVYALHASPDAPTVDIFAGGSEWVDNLSFGALSAPLQVPPGTHGLDFFGHQEGAERPSGAPAAQATTPMLEVGRRYLLVASGFLLRKEEVPGFSLLAYDESFAQAGEQVRLRLIHASPDAPPVDVGAVDGQGVVPTEPAFQDVAYSEASEQEGVALPAAPLTAGVTPADIVARQPTASFPLDLRPLGGAALFVVAAGALSPVEGEEGFQLILVNTTQTPWAAQTVAPR